ncbi:MAG: hypothetical protein AAFN30_02480 [Actinomycetota bacterium]
MSDATTTEPALAGAGGPPPAAAVATGDERLSYRGVFARLLVRPEIGAVIAALSIWGFFWAVSGSFGLASGAASILDVASSPLGIMAVAVAMLMIGGEFDLSSGAATGALGIMTLFFVRDVTGDMGGAGFSLWVALPLSLLVALGLGWFNGTLVNRTSLPSFIVTLGSFFILRGAKLGYAKLVVDQIQVGKMDDLQIAADERGGDRGYAFFNRIFAAEWERNAHIWESRDLVYTLLCLVGLTLVAIAVYELHFGRRETMNPAGLGLFALGLAGGVVGVLYLHGTDGATNDTVGGIILAAATFVGFFGLALWRYQPLTDRGSLSLGPTMLAPLGLGILAVAVAVFFAAALDAQDSERIYFQFTEQGIRAILFVLLAGAGLVLMLTAVARARGVSQLSRSTLLLLTAATVAFLAFFIRSESASPKFRTQVFTIMLVMAGLMATWAVVSLFFTERRHIDAPADRLGQRMVVSGTILFMVGVMVRLLFVVQAEIDAEISRTVFSVRTLWFFGFAIVVSWVLNRTRFGSWTFAVGGNKEAARQIGVPAARTKVQLFMLVSFAAWLVGTLLAFRLNTIQASTGDGEEFEYIIAAVVGGTALTGGYGSTMGAAIGAFIMAMAVQGIPSARWNSDWRFVFLGAILLTAVIANTFIRSRAEATR